MTTSEKILRTAVVSALFAVALALLSRLLFGVVNNALWTLSFGVPTWLIGDLLAHSISAGLWPPIGPLRRLDGPALAAQQQTPQRQVVKRALEGC